jgi:hypothetical protein
VTFLPARADIEQVPEDPLDLIDFARSDEIGNAQVALFPEHIGLILAERYLWGLPD